MYSIDFNEDALQDLISDLLRENFDPYLTSVGGSGLGILSPYGQHRNPTTETHRLTGQVTPPETPTPQFSPVKFEGDNTSCPDPLRALFETRTISELPGWADGLGRWGYV